MPAFKSITSKLLTVVFSFYVFIAITVTVIHIAAEYQDTRKRVYQELQGYYQTFSQGVVLSLWEFDDAQLMSSMDGALLIPSITGVKVTGQQGELLIGLGTIQEEDNILNRGGLIWYKAPLVFEGKDVANPMVLGELTLYSNDNVVLDRVLLSLLFIIVNAVIKTIALWLIFIWVGRILLSHPLIKLSRATREVDFENLDESRIDIDAKSRDEISGLQDSFNQMIEKLKVTKAERDEATKSLWELNQTLQQKINERTVEIKEALNKQEQLNSVLVERTGELNMANTRLKELATTDSLTGFLNRMEFTSQASKEFERTLRYHRKTSVMMMDIDNFKQINDSFSHAAGDEVLKVFADVCRSSLRSQDIVGRMGGEEFSVLLPETEVGQAAVIAERIRKDLSCRNISTLSGAVKATVSIGLSEVSNEDHNIEDTLHRADLALYESKETGRNRITRAG